MPALPSKSTVSMPDSNSGMTFDSNKGCWKTSKGTFIQHGRVLCNDRTTKKGPSPYGYHPKTRSEFKNKNGRRRLIITHLTKYESREYAIASQKNGYE